MMRPCWADLFTLMIFPTAARAAKTIVHDPRLRHLRVEGPREWDDFPERPVGSNISLRFHSDRNGSEWALRFRQQDVKQIWKVLLNGEELGRLRSDENDMVIYFPVPAGRLIAGENKLLIEVDRQ